MSKGDLPRAFTAGSSVRPPTPEEWFLGFSLASRRAAGLYKRGAELVREIADALKGQCSPTRPS